MYIGMRSWARRLKRHQIMGITECPHRAIRAGDAINSIFETGIDEDIYDFVNTINEKNDYYTTSSCAGRLLVSCKSSGEQYSVDWLYITHTVPVVEDDVIPTLDMVKEKGEGETWIKLEPPIVSIRCRNILAAQLSCDFVSYLQYVVESGKKLWFEELWYQVDIQS